jgi:Flp pilus assembly protein TadD
MRGLLFPVLFFLSGTVYAEDRQWPGPEERPDTTSPQAPDTAKKEGMESLDQRLSQAVRDFDDGALVKITEEAEALPGIPGSARGELFLAKCFLARCDLRRFMRKTYVLERKRDKELRKEDATLAEAGLVHAEAALSLEPRSSECHRVTGELHIHQITGPIAGFRYGPKGRQHIEQALEIDPKNAEARRAIGLMYLYNPAINGGDPKKAAATFDQAIQLGGDDRAYVLAGRAYRKIEDIETAKKRFQAALDTNPGNREAKELLSQLQSGGQQ